MTAEESIRDLSNFLSKLYIRVIGSNQFIFPSLVPSRWCRVERIDDENIRLHLTFDHSFDKATVKINIKTRNVQVESFSKGLHGSYNAELYYDGELIAIIQSHEVSEVMPTETETKPEKNRPLNILVLVTNTDYYSGGRYHIYEICVALALIGHNVYISTNMIPTKLVNDFPNLPNIKFITDAPNFIPDGDFDLVFGCPADLMWTAVSYARSRHIPSIVMILETPKWLSEYIPFYPDHKEEYWEYWNQKTALRMADYIFTNSETCKEKLLEWMPELKGRRHRIFPIPAAVNTFAADKVPEQIERNEIVFISRNIKHKQADSIFEAVKDLKNPPLINFIGNNTEVLVEKAKKYGLNARAYPNCQDDIKFLLIKRSMLLVHPSLFEGLGIPPMEALYCGKPVVAYDLPVFRRTYKDTIDYARYGDVKDLGRKIKRLIKNPKLRRQRGQKGRDYVSQRYTFKHLMSRLSKIFPLGRMPIKVSACYIVFNEEQFLEHSLKSIYKFADEIIIIEGAVKGWWQYANPDGSSTDATVDIIENFPDPENKIKLIQGKWLDKKQMQNRFLKEATGNWILRCAGDEIYDPTELEILKEFAATHMDAIEIKMPFIHFYHNENYRLISKPNTKWMIRHQRFFRNLPGIRYEKSMSDVEDSNGRFLASYPNGIYHINNVRIYHYGYCKPPEEIRRKLLFYCWRDKEHIKAGYKTPEEYIRNHIYFSGKGDKSIGERVVRYRGKKLGIL